MSTRRLRPLLVLLATTALLGGCTGTTGSSGPAATPRSAGPSGASAASAGLPAIDGPELEQRALLLLLVDRQVYEPVALGGAANGTPSLRAETALALGRIGDPRGVALLETLLGDAEPSVRRAAAFGLGLLARGEGAGGRLGVGAAIAPLLGAVVDEDRSVGLRAVEGLALAGVPLDRVITRLVEAPAAELLPRLLPSLYRFDGPGVVGWAEQALAEPALPAALRAQAVYALARTPRPEGAPALRRLVDDADPWIRALVARGLGRVGGRSDLELLTPMLDDPDAGAVIQALDAGTRLVERGVAAPPDPWRDRLVALLDERAEERVQVRAAAVDAAAAWLLDDALGQRLVALADDVTAEPWLRRRALLALAEGEDPRAEALVRRAANDPRPDVRTTAARAAGLLGLRPLLDTLRQDADAGVRRGALAVLFEADAPDAAGLAALALGDPDQSVRVAALERFVQQPTLDVDLLAEAYRAADADLEPDARLSAVDALRERAEATPTERGAAVAVLETAAEDRDWLVRRRAARALDALDREPPELGAAAGGRTVAAYREIVHRTWRPQRLELTTERGSVVLELPCRPTPLTCLSLLQLADAGFYDGLEIHRVVPGFVVQGGDPRGDGAGGPGYTLRDELGLSRYDAAGIVGIAHSGPDTAGSQFFVTLAPQPHLDAAYPIVGRVVQGLDRIETLREGDRILRARRLAD
ncbi:MAG: HEAT repeat domain-containing protein [Acidobacteriota bacterium]